MNFYLIGSLEGFNDLRFPNVEDWQNCMGHAEGLLKQWNPPEMEYIWKKSNRHKHFDLSQFCNPLLTISDKALSILENILIKNGEIQYEYRTIPFQTFSYVEGQRFSYLY